MGDQAGSGGVCVRRLLVELVSAGGEGGREGGRQRAAGGQLAAQLQLEPAQQATQLDAAVPASHMPAGSLKDRLNPLRLATAPGAFSQHCKLAVGPLLVSNRFGRYQPRLQAGWQHRRADPVRRRQPIAAAARAGRLGPAAALFQQAVLGAGGHGCSLLLQGSVLYQLVHDSRQLLFLGSSRQRCG